MKTSFHIAALSLAYRSIPYTGRLYFATDFWLDERSAKECGATELFNHVNIDENYSVNSRVEKKLTNYSLISQCMHITQRLEKISASKEEYFLMKALVLSNCDIRLDNYDALNKLRESILGAMNDCVLILR